MKFRLLAGQHIQADKTQKPKIKMHRDPETGEVTPHEVYPSKTYNVNDTFDSDTDLAARDGAKFQRLDKYEAGEDSPQALQSKIAQLQAKLKKMTAGPVSAPTSGPAGSGLGNPVDDNDHPVEDNTPAQQLPDPAQVLPPEEAPRSLPPTLERMSSKDLMIFAEENEINLHGKTGRADVLRIIKDWAR